MGHEGSRTWLHTLASLCRLNGIDKGVELCKLEALCATWQTNSIVYIELTPEVMRLEELERRSRSPVFGFP